MFRFKFRSPVASSASTPTFSLPLGLPFLSGSGASAQPGPGCATLREAPAPLAARPLPALQIRRLNAAEAQWLPGLCELLIDSVHRGACLGFLAPLSLGAAQDYWRSVLARLGPQHELWIACDAEAPEGTSPKLHGAVQLALCSSANAHHRGEVQRLMVHSQSRSRGIASRLMSRLECAALSRGRQLLVLETPSGSQAEAVYVHLGWQRAGEIPAYASCAEGRLRDTVFYFKRLQAPA
ncbi:GNAT family N-acetyltransferase [Paucibacter sp. KBW04]|uniref:GNAT family N-acetyltransferase n=1 Tax=Paucibacter sp. KBW04 TaxID=2153361 RepID=UPI000F55D745|nr:GNAT family N-acetyltransferase [Paucibacter sp. KBW04]RQO61152.1 GNAT family N-acetyltransferase [Paucibacter sp. KBW04]